MEDDGLSRAGMLTSWKEIASFFHREVRTVQRWEREEELPVHRHPHHRRSSVYAYPEELESWWARYQDGGGAALAVGAPAPGASAAHEAPIDVADAPAALRLRHGNPRRGALRWAVVGAVLCAASLGAAGVFLYGGSKARGFPLVDVALLKSPTALEVRSLDDVNGDGRGDVVVQPSGGTETFLYLAASGSEVRSRPDVRIAADGAGHVSGGSVGDVDGDGLADLVVSVLLNEPATYSATGPSYLIRGRREWPETLRLPQDADTEFYVDFRGDIRMNACTTPNGVDLNGDGLRDVLLGGGDYSPPGRPSAGGVFVLFGRRVWPARVEVISTADVTVHGSRTGDALRSSCGAGDFTADGSPDLALVASEDTLWYLQGGRGRVYVFAGRKEWPRIIEAERDATLRLLGSSPGANVAAPLLTDVNGDSVADLVVALSDPAKRGTGGRVGIVFGGRERRGTVSDLSADVLILGGHTFGYALAAGDVNLDGRSDLVASEPDTGSVRMFLGRQQFGPRGHVASFAPILLAQGARGTGAYGLAPGDYDGDGAPDIALEVTQDGAGRGIRRLARLTPSLPIGVEVRPGDAPNVLVPDGVIAVGVWAGSLSQELDTTILRLAGVAPTRLTWQDFNADGKLDLRLYFDVERLQLRPGTTRVALRGRTRAGVPVAGADDVVLISHPPAPAATAGSRSISQHDK